MVYATLYKYVADWLTVNTGAMHVDLWRNQPDNEVDEHPFPYPAILVRFPEATVQSTRGCAAVRQPVVLHILEQVMYDTHTSTQGWDSSAKRLFSRMHECLKLNGHKLPSGHTLVLESVAPASDYAQVAIHEVQFSTAINLTND